MQPDEIIQQKTWQQLTDADKENVFELAANEREYNLLKKMLEVSAEEAADTPLIDPSIKNKLMMIVADKKTGSRKFYWYAAAAVLIIGLVVTLVIKNNPGSHQNTPEVVKNDLPQPTIKKKEDLVQNDTAVIKIKVPVQKTSPVIAKQTFPNKVKRNVAPAHSDDEYAAIDTKVSSDRSLLSLVTEIY